MLASLDLLLRGAVIGTVAMVVVVLMLRPETRRKAWPVAALGGALAGHMMLPAVCPDGATWESCGAAIVPARLLPVAVTWFVLEIFVELPGRRLPAAGLLLASVAASGLWIFAGGGTLCIFVATGLYGTLLVLALLTARGDLVESRRVFRPAFAAAVAVFGVIRTMTDGVFGAGAMPDWLSLAYAATFLAFSLTFAIWVLSPGRDVFAEARPRSLAGAEGATPADRLALTRIEAAMAGELWRREGLTIGQMAEELGIPEHRLRRAINGDLGYRNFSTFVNGYRIDAAKAALAAPENAQRTILEIAYDCGFASLAPFNRAFRAATGLSPRDFRRDPDGADASISA